MDYTSIVIEVKNGEVVGVYGRDENIDVEVLIDIPDPEDDDKFADELDLLTAQHPFILYSPRKQIGVCRFCGSPLYASKVYGYKYECLECDEDFYSFEQE